MSAEGTQSITNSRLRVKDLQTKLANVGYFVDDTVAMKIFLSLHYKGKGLSTVLLDGAAGSGKTSLVEALAHVLNANLELYQGVATTSEEALVFDIDIAATIAKDVDNINKKGKLVKAIENSEKGFSLLFLDEWDKTRPEMDSFLLDFLQSGRLTGTALGDFQVCDLSKLIVFIAKNDDRELSEPLIRRCRVIYLPVPKPEMVRDILTKIASDGTDKNVLNWVVRVYSAQYNIQNKMRKIATIQEMYNALLDDNLIHDSYDIEHRKENLLGWMAQYADDKELTEKIALRVPMYYPSEVYKELGVPERSYVDITHVLMQAARIMPKEVIQRKSKFAIWAFNWFLHQYYLPDVQRKMTLREVTAKIHADNGSDSVVNRIYAFLSVYQGNAFAGIDDIPSYIDEKGEKTTVTQKQLLELFSRKKR